MGTVSLLSRPRTSSHAARVAPAPPDRSGGRTSPASPDSPDASLTGLAASDLREVDRAVTAIALRPAAELSPDALFAAARACEDKLLDPGRAVALYDRIVADYPDARVSIAATRRAQAIRALIGSHGEAAAQGGELARLIARADEDPPATTLERGDRLARADWPGAAAAALWLADWQRRTGQLADAQARYAAIAARWPQLPQGQAALRSGVGCALDAHAWSLAEALARRLPAADPAARLERDALLDAAARGRGAGRLYAAAWLAIGLAFAVLLASIIEAAVRSPRGTRLAALRPPIEIAFLAPVAAVLIGVAFTAHRLIAPAVATIALGGLVQAWLSGAALARLRDRGRAHRLRSLGHIAVCFVGVAALGYVALTRDHLLDMLLETVRLGPEP